jgi:hypothetical protein
MFALLALGASLATPACNTANFAQRVHAVQTSLFTINESKDDLPIDPPRLAQQEVPKLRIALTAAITGYMQCEAVDITDPASLQSGVAKLLNANRPESAAEQKRGYPDHTYGDDLTIRVQAFRSKENTIAVDANFSTGCGQDHVLLLFNRQPDHWFRTLDWQSDKYTKPNDAFGDFFLYTAAPGSNGAELVAVAHGNPWCTSRFSGFDVDLLQPATSQTPQRHIAHTDNVYSRGDTTPTLKSVPDGITLRLDSSSRDLEGVFTYIGVFRFRTTSNTLERMPVANNARNFVDSWLDESWPIADRWSAQPSRDLHLVHDRFDYSIGSKDKNVPNISYGPVRACSDANKFQIEMQLDDDPHLYGQVRQNTGSFTMLAITSKPDLACTGPDLMAKHPKH